MDGIYDLGISRLTNDIDFALYVPDWDNYNDIIQTLIASGQFGPTNTVHKLIYKGAYEIDIVPFGDIQDNSGQYTWPPDHVRVMNVAGFVEIDTGCLNINTDGLTFKVASIPGVCVMKLLAWKDRGLSDNRDSKDLGFILTNYIELKYEDLYTAHEDLMITVDFDRFVISAQIMGRDIYTLLNKNLSAIQQIKNISIAETIDEEYSRLAMCLKEGGISTYIIAYKCITAIIKGLEDKQLSN